MNTASGRIRQTILVVGFTMAAFMALPASTSSAASNDDWSMFGHDPLHGGASAETTIGASNVATLSPQWSQTIGTTPEPVLASPAVAFDPTLQKTLVYDINVAGTAQAFDAVTGATVWQQTVPNGITGTGAADGDVASPVVDGNTVYFGTTGALVAMDATTGAIQCSFNLPVVPPEAVPGIIDSAPVVGRLDASGPIVYFGDKGNTERKNAGHEWAVTGVGNIAGGCQQVWVWNGFAKAAGSWSEPALTQDSTGRWLLVFGSSQNDDSVYALDAVQGSFVWRYQTAQNGPDQDVGAGPTISPPGVNGFADGVVYIDGKDRVEYALDLATGSKIWSFDMNANAGQGTNSVAVADLVADTIYVPYAHFVYALDATTGAVIWRSSTGTRAIYSSPAISGAAGDQVLIVGNGNAHEVGLRLADGAGLLSVKAAAPIFASAAISNGMVFAATYAGSVFALGAPGGPPARHAPGGPPPGRSG